MKKIKLSNGTEITMREPKVRDMRIVTECTNEMEKEINLIANLSGLNVEEIDELSWGDFRKLDEGLKSFL